MDLSLHCVSLCCVLFLALWPIMMYYLGYLGRIASCKFANQEHVNNVNGFWWGVENCMNSWTLCTLLCNVGLRLCCAKGERLKSIESKPVDKIFMKWCHNYDEIILRTVLCLVIKKEKCKYSQIHTWITHNDVNQVLQYTTSSLVIRINPLHWFASHLIYYVLAWSTSQPSKQHLDLLLACIHKPLNLELSECLYSDVRILLVENHICQSSRSIHGIAWTQNSAVESDHCPFNQAIFPELLVQRMWSDQWWQGKQLLLSPKSDKHPHEVCP